MSEKLTGSVTFKCREEEKDALEDIAKEKGVSLSKLVRDAIIHLIRCKGSFYFAQAQTGLTTSISDTLDTNVIVFKNGTREVILQVGPLMNFLEVQLDNKPKDEPIPEFELVPQPHRIIDVTPKTKLIGTKKAQLFRPTELLLPFSN